MQYLIFNFRQTAAFVATSFLYRSRFAIIMNPKECGVCRSCWLLEFSHILRNRTFCGLYPSMSKSVIIVLNQTQSFSSAIGKCKISSRESLLSQLIFVTLSSTKLLLRLTNRFLYKIQCLPLHLDLLHQRDICKYFRNRYGVQQLAEMNVSMVDLLHKPIGFHYDY